MTKSFLKKYFIKIARFLNYEIIDQSNFYSPTLEANLNDNFSKINKKSIVLPLGEVKITREIKSLLIVFRSNTEINLWDQNKKRIFDMPKNEYTLRSLSSLIKSIIKAKSKFQSIAFKIIVVDDNSNRENLLKIGQLLKNRAIENKIENLNKIEFEN